MRFWIIIIVVVTLVVGFALYAFKGILGFDSIEKENERLKKTDAPKEDTQSSFFNNKQTTSPPIVKSRNSVKFKHRPVPTTAQLKSLTDTSASSKDDENNQRVIAIPDIPTNTVLLYGELLEVERLAEALRSMDQVIQTCHLKTWVIFIRQDKEKGFDILGNLMEGIVTDPVGSIGGGIFSFTAGIKDLQATINLNNSRGLIEIVDQPYMQLLHGTPSSISTLEEVAIPTTTLSDGIAETSISFKKVGLTVDVTPFFLDKDRVRLQVKQSNGVIGGIRNIAGNEIPEISTQDLETSAELRMGQVLILGGVESVSRETSRTWLSKSDRRQLGHLYVVCAVYSSIPKGIPTLDLSSDIPINPRSPSSSLRDQGKNVGRTWLDGGNLLPTRN